MDDGQAPVLPALLLEEGPHMEMIPPMQSTCGRHAVDKMSFHAYGGSGSKLSSSSLSEGKESVRSQHKPVMLGRVLDRV